MVLLLARTHYSLLTAPASPAALCEAAVLAGHDHLALVDGNGLYGLWPFAQETARVGLCAVFGCELVHAGRRLFALARDRDGYASLCELLSERHLRSDFDLPRAAARLSAGLVFLCRDLELLPQLAARLPRGQLFVALGPRGQGSIADHAPQAASRKAPDPGGQPARSELLAAARDLDVEPCAVRDVWLPRREDHALHQLFLAVKWNRTLRQGDDGDSDGALPGIA